MPQGKGVCAAGLPYLFSGLPFSPLPAEGEGAGVRGHYVSLAVDFRLARP